MNLACQVGTVQGHGGSIMVWGVFSWHFLSSARKWSIPARHLHLSQVPATAWLDERSSDFSVMNWPPRSPDLNPIEHIWDVLEKGVKAHHTTPAIFTKLWTALTDVWQAIPVERKLVESLPRRVAAVINARGTQLVIKVLSLIQWHFSVSGTVNCELCSDTIYYKKRGFSAISSHLQTKKHLSKVQVKHENVEQLL
ncbi:hypothetical protein AVEN_119217-1 [Araneus ventricosus]|uniref:Tc1-like transposase DDE domain-containing protein n=1 Tax=Araneus ventricosus TaxID=182803 RepID=A0A4Y2NZG1_ARAVE|nr:hypothetical protein AVEN_119217-1 [Araneus ventricosus]